MVTVYLNELNFFHVSSGGLLPDIMHDILEGALAYESKLMLERCIRQEKYFQLADLNHMITNFQFGYTEVRNRPTIISNATISGDDNTLKQNGVCVCVCVCLMGVLIVSGEGGYRGSLNVLVHSPTNQQTL